MGSRRNSELRKSFLAAGYSPRRVNCEQALGRLIWPQPATTATACGRRGDRHYNRRSLRALAEDGFQRQTRIEVFCSQPLAVKKRRLVLVPGVAEKRDECLASAMLLRETEAPATLIPLESPRNRPSSRRSW